jgi:predicted DNA-binding protein (MmcQ/YjbR family)
MQYYNEEKMHNLRVRLEQEILKWPDVSTRKMYGCPCYKYKDKLFAFLVTDGIVLVRVSEEDTIKLSEQFTIKPFQAGEKRIMYRWPVIPVDDSTDLQKILPFIKNSYYQSKT